MANAARDDNFVTTLSAVSSADHSTPVNVDVDPTTRRLLVNASISGSVATTSGGASDGTAFTAGTSQGSLVMGAYESSPTSLASGSAGVIGLTAKRAVKVSAVDSAGNDATDTVNNAMRVNVVAGSSGNAAASATGSAVPASADYQGINIAGTLRGRTGSAIGTTYIAHSDITSVAQGTAIATGNGVTTAGTLRVTLSSDGTGQVALATGANTIGALTANQSVNVNQFGGTAVITGNGVTTGATPRVTLSSDSTGQVALATGSNTIGTAFVDLKKINGTATDSNNGTVSAGTIRVTVASDSTGQIIALGNVAGGATDSGNPVKVGAFATATLSTATLRTAAQRTNFVADLDEAVIIRPNATLGDITSGTANVTSTASATVIAAGGASVKVYLKSITIANANGTSQLVEVMDGNITKWLFPVPCGTAGVTHGGVTHTFDPALPGSANTAWNVRCSAAGGNVYVSANGFKSKV